MDHSETANRVSFTHKCNVSRGKINRADIIQLMEMCNIRLFRDDHVYLIIISFEGDHRNRRRIFMNEDIIYYIIHDSCD